MVVVGGGPPAARCIYLPGPDISVEKSCDLPIQVYLSMYPPAHLTRSPGETENLLHTLSMEVWVDTVDHFTGLPAAEVGCARKGIRREQNAA